MTLIRTVLVVCVFALTCAAAGNMAFTVSMPQPASHTYHVDFRCDGLTGAVQDFKMPQWSPGYYGIGNYARYVSNFRAEDGGGRPLQWEKVSRNTWRVVADNAPAIALHYDVYAAIAFPANSYLGEDRGYISPATLFVHPAGALNHSVTVRLEMPKNWSRISTGLDMRKGSPDTFEAPDFDVLYDCPILMGNQEHLQFEVKGVPHHVAIENVAADVDRARMSADLKSIVTAATSLMGDVPYRHYTFLMMGRGNGGIEHSNSSSNQFDGNSLSTPAGYLRWLSFIAHEYFHNFNVKRIRPIALGPFDYDQENLTNMLWVSEGLSVYYQDLVLVRAELMSPDQYLAKMSTAIGSFENASGRRYQSAVESSQNTWNSGSGVGGDRKTSISYYNNGAMIGAMLDLRIREASGNRKSLDDVMRTMYRKYYQEKKRGFTDAEFRAECDAAAGADLAGIFAYASTTREVDYARYFALAGVKLEVSTAEAPGGFIGLNTHSEEIPPAELPGGGGRGGRGAPPPIRMLVTDFAANSPASNAGLAPGDRIVAIEGSAPSAAALNSAIEAKKPGESLMLRVSSRGAERDVAIRVAPNTKATYRLSVDSAATEGQNRIRDSWLRKAQ